MVDGPVSLQKFDRAASCGGADRQAPAFVRDDPSPEVPTAMRVARPDRMQAYAVMAAALVDAGLVHRHAEDVGPAPFVDLAELKAITERRDVSSRIGSLIRQYLGSLAEIPASVVPDPARPHGAFEVTRWCIEIGRAPAGESGLVHQ